MTLFKIIIQFYIALVKSKMEYRFNFFIEIFVNVFTYTITYIGIWIILEKFNSISGWGYYEVLLLYNFNLVTYGLASLFFYVPMQSLDELVKEGDFDSMLTKPLNPFFHLLLKQFYLGFLGHVLLGTIVFIICFNNLSITWSFENVLFFFIMLIGGTLIQASIIIFSGTLSLKFIQATAVMNTLIYNVRDFINYPIKIYNKCLQILLTFIVPYAFVNFYPAEFFLNKKEGLIVFPISKYGTIIIGSIMFVLAYKFFMSSIKNYQSTGS